MAVDLKDQLPPEDQAGEPITPGEQAELDQLESSLRDGESAKEPSTHHPDNLILRREPHGLKSDNVLGPRSSRRRRLIFGGVGVGGLGGLGIIIFLLLLFKNVHIKNLFIDYEFAKFNRAFRNRLTKNIEEADAKGNADTPDPGLDAPPDVQMTAADTEAVNTARDQIANDPAAWDDQVAQLEAVDQSAAGTVGTAVDPEYSIDRSIQDETGKPSDQVAKDTDSSIAKELDGGETARGAPIEAAADAATDAQTAIDSGGSEAAVAKAAQTGFARGMGSFLHYGQGALVIATLGCIGRDIYINSYHAVAELKLAFLGRSAATVNKYADCQKQSHCTLAQQGEVAKKFDSPTQSFTKSCAYVRAIGKVAVPIVYDKNGTNTNGGNCDDLDSNLMPNSSLAAGIDGNVHTALAVADFVNSAFSIPGLGSGCDLLLKPLTQAALAGVNVIATGVLAVTGVVDFGVSDVAVAAGTAGAVVLGSKIGTALALDAALHYGGLYFKRNFSPIQWGNMVGAGDKAISADSCRADGCRPLTAQENQQISLAIHADQVKENAQRGLAWQLFSPHNPTSTMGQLADQMPSSPGTAMAAIGHFFATILSPGKLATSLGHTFNPASYAWAADSGSYTYGIPDYGIPDSELNAPGFGMKENSAWVQQNVLNDSGLKQKFDDCLNPSTTKFSDLLDGPNQPSNGATCDGYYHPNDPNYLKFAHYRIYRMDQRAAHAFVLLHNNEGGSGSNTGQAQNPSGDGQPGSLPSDDSKALAQQLLSSPNVTKSGRLVTQDLQDAAQGQPSSAGAPLSHTLLGLLVTLAKDHKYDISALESGGTGHATSSLHYTGDAVDIDSLDGTPITGRNAPALTIINLWAPLLPSGSGFGQVNCGVTPTLPAGITSFSDSCNHLHTQIPRGTP